MNRPTPEPVVEIRDLRIVVGGRQLLRVPELTIHRRERVALVGPNGAGKSSLLRVLGGFLPVGRGRVNVLGNRFGDDGQPALKGARLRRLRCAVGQVMQGLHLVPRLSALDNVVIGALARPGAAPRWRTWVRWYPEDLRDEARQALTELGLEHRLHARADRLSGGERQKVSLARLRLQRPRLILADEPTAALDPVATRQACQALLSIAHDATLLTVVHDASLLTMIADRVIGLAAGQVRFDVPVDDLTPRMLDRLYQAGDAPDASHFETRADLPAALSLRTRSVPPVPDVGPA